jgi:hypothetical protein
MSGNPIRTVGNSQHPEGGKARACAHMDDVLTSSVIESS